MSYETVFALATVGGICGYLHLKKRIGNLEQKLENLRPEQVSPRAPLQPLTAHIASEAPAPLMARPAAELGQVVAPPRTFLEAEDLFEMPSKASPPTVPAPAGPPSAWSQATDSLVGMVKKNPFASLGVLLMLVGVGFLFALLAASNILPPAVRVALLALAGMGTFAVGLKQEKARYGLALNLQGGGLAVEFLCALWAYQGYELISPLTAFLWMGGLSTLAIGWAAVQKRALFAFMGLAGSLLTPIFASTGQGEFSGLTLYCAWVSALALGAGYHLRVPSLVGAALAGISVLLGGALKIAPGSAVISGFALMAMWVAYSGAAVNWTRRAYDWSGRQQASIVSALLGAPLIMAGFLYGRGGLSAKGCAVWLGLTSLTYLVSMLSASDKWKAGLFAIGTGLGLVALGVGLEGAGMALALSAGTMGLIMVARTMQKPWARIGALVYWLLAVMLGLTLLDPYSRLSAMPLALSGAVALAAAYLFRGSRLGKLYALATPLVLAIACLFDRDNLVFLVPEWFFAWGVLSYLTGKAVRWLELRLSAAWFLPTGLGLFFTTLPTLPAPGATIHREVVLIAWALGSALLIWAYHKDPLVKFSLSRKVLARATLALPVMTSIEMLHVLWAFEAAPTVAMGSLMLLWAAWHLISRAFRKPTGFDAEVRLSGAAAAALVVLNVLAATPGLGWTVAQWTTVSALAYGMLRFPSTDARRGNLVIAGLAGAVALGTVLRGIGLANNVEASVLVLAVTRLMQPWISVLWAAASIAVVAFASGRKSRQLWMGGGVAVLALIAKMLLVDLATFTLVAKVAVFLVTGLGFVVLGYFCPLPPDQVAGEESK